MSEILNVVPHHYLEFLDRGRYFASKTVLRDIQRTSPVTFLLFAPHDRITVYMHWAFTTTDAIHVELFRNPTVTFEGVGMALVNQQLASAHTPATRVHVAGTVSDPGTVIAEQQFVSGAGIQQWDTNPLYILAPDAVYMLRFTADTDTNVLNATLGFGEKY